MKIILLILIALISTSFTLTSQDFRKATCGMSQSQVKSSEDSKLVDESSDILIYETTLAGYEVLVGYIFAEGMLARAKYILTETHYNDNDYISDYYVLNGLLKKKYGDPVEDETFWKSDSPYENDKSFWGHCISQGDLILYSTYRTSDTEIEISLSAEDYTVVNVIQYSSRSAELKSIEEEKILEDF